MPIKLVPTTPKKSLNKAYLKVRPLRSEIDLFKSNLITLLDKVKNDESEEHQKNNIRDFLLNTYYRGINEINTKGTQDLVIHTDKSAQSSVGVIIEAKRPSNKAEWITSDKINVKALQELVLYYMRERVDAKNIDIKYLVATNIHEWYIFDAAYFDKVFYGNRHFVKKYEDWRDGKKVTKETSLFYNDIAKPFIDALDEEITATYFDIRDYEKELRNEDKADDKKLIALQKLLSPSHLLKVSFANDSNELNSKFYKELLHIIGLEEVKDGGKQIIRRKVKDASEGSMIENTINILKTEDVLFRLKNKSIYGETKEEQYYNIALELNLTWINRILFLKLLEGQLLSYHRNDKRYNFLNKDVVFDYDEIYKLFHQVLAKTTQDRSGAIIHKYQWVPYLNSSLFEISELENQTIKINSLDDHAQLDVMNGSILTKYKNQSINPLQYLFEFLDAYDFASEGVEEVQEDSRTLINASILGKIFEKINGYKDGSIYTPGFITMYMCRQAIRRAVVQKFKDAYGWDIKEFDDIRNYIADRRSKSDILAFNALINSLRLCDPAVGSGHFLVSALNEMVLIKYELGIWCDSEGIRITDYDLIIENDELIVTHSNGDIFEYQIIQGKPKSKEDQRLQKTLFYEKQTIIENCLFGVDINPNSVKICRLRLWIELLKNAYYKEDNNYTELETLPNIDINIKCGNSLISRFGLDADLGTALKSIKYDIKTYRGFVQDYKNCKDREAKRGIEDIINAIKSDFRSEIGKKDKDVLKLNALSGELFNLVNQQSMFETDKEKKAKDVKVKKLEGDINALSAKIDDIKSNAIYRDAFEWRFEFPEVLNDNGDFEGFDVVVGNPPYGVKFDDIQKWHYKTNYKATEDIYTMFIELSKRISAQKSIVGYIIPVSWLSGSKFMKIREFISFEFSLVLAINLPYNVFSDAYVDTGIYLFNKENSSTFQSYEFDPKYKLGDNDLINLKLKVLEKSGWTKKQDLKIILNHAGSTIFEKMESFEYRLGDLCYTTRGILAEKSDYREIYSTNLKPVFVGNLNRYYLENKFNYIKFGENLKERPKNYNVFCDGRILVRRIINRQFRLMATYTNEEFICKKDIYIVKIENKKINAKYLLAIINSKLISYYKTNSSGSAKKDDFTQITLTDLKELPIPIPLPSLQIKIESLTEKLIYNNIHHLESNNEELENQIDQMVYELYGLTEDEIKVVEGNDK